MASASDSVGDAKPLAPQPSEVATRPSKDEKAKSFQDVGHLLDVRLLRALAKLGFSHPTPVQEQVLPLALAGKDVLARARTGSGKTLAYGLPILQRVLLAKQAKAKSDIYHQATRALVLVPTRELSEQVTHQLNVLLPFLDKEVNVVNVARDVSKNAHKILLAERPDVVVSTPSRAYEHVKNGHLELDHLESLAIDEADLILSYGHDEALRSLLSSGTLPKTLQWLCMSATMTRDVKALKGLMLKEPKMLDIADPESSTLTQYSVHVRSAADKFLLTYVILRLRLIRGKCIIFVNDIDRCYRLKLFLEQFGVKSTVLNEELPVNSRYHIVQEFNKGVYDYIIATDESRFGADAAEVSADAVQDSSASSSKGAAVKNAEYGVSRGVDFVSVSCVLNFDLPVSAKGYTHRVGRTARAGRTGTSLSFVVPREAYEDDMQGAGGGKAGSANRSRHLVCPTTEHDERVWRSIIQQEAARHQTVHDWTFDRSQVEAFRYRMEDALRSVTRHAIRDARIRELKQEMLNSERLKAHFEDNPTDLEYLRHDKVLRPLRVQSHLKHIPHYLMPRIRGTQAKLGGDGGSGASSEDSVNGSASAGEKRKGGHGETDGVPRVTFDKRPRPHARGGRGDGRRGGGRGGSRGGASGGGRKKGGDPLRKFGR